MTFLLEKPIQSFDITPSVNHHDVCNHCGNCDIHLCRNCQHSQGLILHDASSNRFRQDVSMATFRSCSVRSQQTKAFSCHGVPAPFVVPTAHQLRACCVLGFHHVLGHWPSLMCGSLGTFDATNDSTTTLHSTVDNPSQSSGLVLTYTQTPSSNGPPCNLMRRPSS